MNNIPFIAVVVPGDDDRLKATPVAKHSAWVDGKLIHHVYALEPNRTLRLIKSFDTIEEMNAAGFLAIPSLQITVHRNERESMKTSRMSMKQQWVNIGKGAFKRGLKVEAVLTGKESIDSLIQSGYNAAAEKKGRNILRHFLTE